MAQPSGSPYPSFVPHIFAVDDDSAMRALIADYLSENNLRVSTAGSGQEMRRVLAEQTIDLAQDRA